MASVEKRGNSYRIKVSCGYKTDGKQVTQKMTRTPDPNMTEKQIGKELQRQVVLFEEECRRGQVVSAVKFEAFAEEWFEEYAKLNLKSTTYTRQRQLTKRVHAAIGHIRLDRLTTREIQKFINSLTQDGVNENTGKPLSRKTMIHYLSFTSTVIDYAIKMNMISDNPCRRVTIPKGSKKERKILTIEETEEFFKLLKTAPLKYQAFFTLDIYTDTTKTENSVRFVKVPMEIVEVLLLYKKEQDEERIKLGSKWHETDRLFVKYDGQPMNPQTPYGWLKEFCEKNNFPFYGIHQFWHLHTSLLIGAGIDPTTVSGILGNSQVSTTLNLYSHMFRENQIKACDAVANALSFTAKQPTETENPHHENDTENDEKIE